MRQHKAARYRLVAHPDVLADLTTLAAYGADVVDAARLALDDLAHGRITGKALGERHVSGDLTGFASAKFDIPGSPTRRFRVVYADIDAATRGIIAIGVREDHMIYRLAVQRFDANRPEDDQPQ